MQKRFMRLGRCRNDVACVNCGAARLPTGPPRRICDNQKGHVVSSLVNIHEVGPRDGLQNEARVISVGQKVALVKLLASSGLRDIEVGSFVSPRWVPQMADTDQVMAQLPALAGVTYAFLVPNMRGWQGFAAARGDRSNCEIAVFVSASEGFSQSNLNCSIAQSVANLAPVVEAAFAAGVGVRGYVSCVTDCPFDGQTAPAQVADAVGMLRDVAPMRVSLGDTLGNGSPERVTKMLEAVLKVVPAAELAGHFHDTGGRALANIETALELGLRAFDSAVGGLGGCPYAPGAPGNVATEAVLSLLDRLGYETGVDPAVIAQAAEMARVMR
jgi:hydroxymethylglutaryl-CoA lyase